MKNFSRRIYVLKINAREKGIKATFKKVIVFLFRPFEKLIKRNTFLLEFYYGFLLNFKKRLPFYCQKSKEIKFSQNELVKNVRRFWYSNNSGQFNLGEEKITRKDIFTYGGPNPKFSCSSCQKSEWLSRIRQKNLFSPHSCPQAKECEDLCGKQGNELWTHYHQNFDFALGYDSDLPTPKCLFLRPIVSLNSCCDLGFLVGSRRLAYAFQRNIVERLNVVNWEKYDFLWMFIDSFGSKFPRPNIPVILYGHDFWPAPNKFYQWVIDWVKPDIFLTSYPSQWKEHFKFSSHTKIVFFPLFPSFFFTRSNLKSKKLDLLVIGAISASVYKPRLKLNRQVSQLDKKYKIEFSHHIGYLGTNWHGPACYSDSNGRQINYLNKWSEYLGSAKYVIFGRMEYPILAWKYYETLGSGAIPIFPEAPDLKLLGIRPFEHYIPLPEVEGNNEKLSYFLDHYEDFKYVAENAVKWYKENSDRMLFEDFENLIREITGYKYPKRLI